MADEKKILIEIDLDIARSAKSISDLKDLQKTLNAELKKTEIGTDAYKKFEAELGLVDKRLKDVTQDTKLNQAAQSAQAGSLRDLQSQYNKYVTALRETAPGNKVLGLSFEDAQKKANGLKGEIKDFEAKLGNFTPNVGNYTNSIKDAATQSGILGQYTGQLSQIQGVLKAGFGQAAVGANGLKTAMIAIPIFALIAGIALLISYFSKNDDANDKLGGSLKALGAIFDAIIGNVIGFLSGLTDLGNVASKLGDFFLHPIDTITELADATVKEGKRIAELAKQAYILEVAFRDLEDAQDAFTVAQAKGNQQVTNLILQSKNITKSYEARKDALKQASDIELSTSQQAIKLAEKKLDLTNKQIAADQASGKITSQDEANKKRFAAEVELINLQTDSLNLQEKIQNRSDALAQAESAAAQKRVEDRKKLLQQQQQDAFALFKAQTDYEIAELNRGLKSADLSYQERLNIIQKVAIDQQAIEVANRKFLITNTELTEKERQTIIIESNSRVNGINQSYIESKKALDAELVADAKKNQESIFNLEQSRLSRQLDGSKIALQNQKLNDRQRFDLITGAANTEILIEQNKASQLLLNQQLTEAARIQIIEESEYKIANIISYAEAQKQAAALKTKQIDELVQNAKKKLFNDTLSAIISMYDQNSTEYKVLASAQAIINTYLAATAALASGSEINPVLGVVSAANAIVNGLASVAKINGVKFEDGGIAGNKQGVIGGNLHSSGGTKFYGSDGSFFEAERGELLTVVNRHDTGRLSSLSQLNSGHGKPFFADGGVFKHNNYLQDGGIVARSAGAQVYDEQRILDNTLRVIASMPAPVVGVKDIQIASQKRNNVRVKANLTK